MRFLARAVILTNGWKRGLRFLLARWCGPSRYDILPYLGAATGERQGEMFAIDAENDIDFLRRVLRVRRQVK